MLKRSTIIIVAIVLLTHVLILTLLLKTNASYKKSKEITRQIETLNDNMRETQIERDLLNQIIENESKNKTEHDVIPAKTNVTEQSSTVKDSTGTTELKIPGLDLEKLNADKDIPTINANSLPISKPDPNYKRKSTPRIPAKLVYTNNTIRGAQSYLKGSNVAKSGILVDLDTMNVLWAKDQTKQLSIASLSKIMTMLLAYEIAMDDNSPYTLQSRIPVTKEAINTAPSKVDFAAGETYLLKELFTAAAVRSANDAAELMADHLGGGKCSVFIDEMNLFAKELGMTSTHYTNPHGLPGKTAAEDNKSTVEDLARLCVEFRKVPYLRDLVSERTAGFREKTSPKYMLLVNHNNLLPGNKYQYTGVNGIKTGFTNRAGSCVAATCTREGHTLLAIILGAPSAQDRDYLAQALFTWGYKRIGVPEPAKTTTKAKK